VLGIPITGSPLGGWDALLATVQMPPGFPVGTLALDKVGAKNAAWMAAQIIALHDPEVDQKIKQERQKMRDAVEEAARTIEGK
ncbi:MAG: 5-(carboxyamino)imidazole ribonucleotide mutase, partial [Desulfoplanes sp.]|nr:5-(carboxyamino)imidazole ribonucleotide mutase [Desulfoplanes sp.]